MGLNSIERIDEIVIAVKVELSKEEIQKLEASYVPKMSLDIRFGVLERVIVTLRYVNKQFKLGLKLWLQRNVGKL